MGKTFTEYLDDVYSKLQIRQDSADTGVAYKKGPGRHRKNKCLTRDEIHKTICNYMNKNIKKVISNKRSQKRKDAMITIFFRVIKKLTYELIQKCATKNLYKRSEVLDFTMSFCEAHHAFLSLCGESYEVRGLQSFIEFIIIFFPPEKSKALLLLIRDSGEVDQEFITQQIEFLSLRKVTTKKHIYHWVKNSWTLNKMFTMAHDILDLPEFCQDKSSEHLRKTVFSFISEN